MGVFIISHPVCIHLGGPVRKTPPPAGGQLVTVGNNLGLSMASERSASCLRESVEARWPPPSPPASDCSPLPPLLAEAWFPGPRLNCKGLPTRLLQPAHSLITISAPAVKECRGGLVCPAPPVPCPPGPSCCCGSRSGGTLFTSCPWLLLVEPTWHADGARRCGSDGLNMGARGGWAKLLPV